MTDTCRHDRHGVGLGGRHEVARLVLLHLGHVHSVREASHEVVVGLRPGREAAALHGLRGVRHIVERLVVRLVAELVALDPGFTLEDRAHRAHSQPDRACPRDLIESWTPCPACWFVTNHLYRSNVCLPSPYPPSPPASAGCPWTCCPGDRERHRAGCEQEDGRERGGDLLLHKLGARNRTDYERFNTIATGR